MNAAQHQPQPWWWRSPTAAIEAACTIAVLAGGLALLTVLPYDDIVRGLLSFKFYAGYGGAS